MKTWLRNKLRAFLGVQEDKEFLLLYSDAISSRIDNHDVKLDAIEKEV